SIQQAGARIVVPRRICENISHCGRNRSGNSLSKTSLTDQHATSPGSNFMQGSPVRRQAVQFLTRARITKVERDLAVVAFDPRQGLSVARESNGACVCELRFRSLPASTTNSLSLTTQTRRTRH